MDMSTAEATNIFNSATDQARTIVQLHVIDLTICLIILLTVVGLITFAAIKFRHRPGDAEPQQSPGNVKFEITWTVIPAIILFVLAILTAQVMQKVNPPVGSQQPDVIINAHQWWWEYRYPKTGVVTANELFLPQGKNLLLELRAADVIHSFWVPDFGEKTDAIPGHPNHLFLKPFKKGLFLGSCSEFCGADHALMRIVSFVVTPEEYDAWTKRQLHVPPPPTDKVAQQGEALFMSKTCVQCHTIAGTTAKGMVGPDLTHVGERKSIGSGIVPRTTELLTRWIQNPQQFKPGCYMPKMHLSYEEAHDIAVYLESLR